MCRNVRFYQHGKFDGSKVLEDIIGNTFNSDLQEWGNEPITNDCNDYGMAMEFSDTTTFTSDVGISAGNTGTTFTGYVQVSVITNYCDDDFTVEQSFTDLKQWGSIL